MTPDMFNNEFSLLNDAAVVKCIRSYTHGYPVLMLNGFADAWTYGKSGPEKYAAFPQNGAAAVHDAEQTYRSQIVARGVMMLQSEAAILQGFATQLAQLAPAYIEAATGTPMNPALQSVVWAFVSQSLATSLSVIEKDYIVEINSIVAQLPATMAANGVSY